MEGDIYRLLFNSIILFNYKFTARQTQSGQSLPLSIRVFVRLIFMVWFKAILSVQLSTSKRGKIIKRLVEKLMSSVCPIWEHMQSHLSLETQGRRAHHRRCLWFYPITEKPLKNVESDVCWIQTPLTAHSPTLSRVFSYLCWCLVTVTKQNCFLMEQIQKQKQGDWIVFPADANHHGSVRGDV